MKTAAQSHHLLECAGTLNDVVPVIPRQDRVATLLGVLIAHLPDDECEALGNLLGRYPHMKVRDMRTAEASYEVTV